MPNNGYFDVPFGVSGTLTTVPDAIQSNGSVSYTQGYGVLYSTPTGSGGFDFPRAQHNQVLLDITTAIQKYQQNTIAPFITTSMNNGTPYSYAQYAMVLSGGVAYQSLIAANTDTPPSKNWAVVNPFFTMIPTAQAGATYTYLYSDAGQVKLRSNSGAVMADTLPGTVLPANQSFTVANTDASALMTVAAGGSAQLNGVTNGFVYIAPGHRLTFVSDGTNYWTTTQQGRLRLTADTTIFVSPSGNDSNSGLTSGTAFLTIQAALNLVANKFDMNGHTMTVSVADGTYTGGANLSQPFVGGKVILQGNVGTPANCIISTTAVDCIVLSNEAQLSTQGIKFTNSGGGNCFNVGPGGILTVIGPVNFGTASSAHLYANFGGQIIITSNYTISGGAVYHADAFANAQIQVENISAITLTGTPAFTIFANASGAGCNITIYSDTFSGSATGTRYGANLNAVIDTNGAGATYLPGNSAGSTATGGQYA